MCTRGRGSSQNKEEQMQRWAISETQHKGEAGEEKVADKTERKQGKARFCCLAKEYNVHSERPRGALKRLKQSVGNRCSAEITLASCTSVGCKSGVRVRVQTEEWL